MKAWCWLGVPLAGELPGEQEEGKKSWQGGLERCCDRGFRSEEAIQTMKKLLAHILLQVQQRRRWRAQ